jgi:hypothetical protein
MLIKEVLQENITPLDLGSLLWTSWVISDLIHTIQRSVLMISEIEVS